MFAQSEHRTIISEEKIWMTFSVLQHRFGITKTFDQGYEEFKIGSL